MKGVVFIGGESPRPDICRKLAQDAYIIIAADSGLIAAEAAGIKPNWIIGDMDSLEDKDLLEKYPPDIILQYPVDKDLTDTELACEFLFNKNCNKITLIGGGGGRLAHIMALLAMFERELCPVRWRTANEDIFLLKEAGKFNVDSGTMISIFPAGQGPWNVTSKNLKWKLDDLVWSRGYFGISNTALKKNISIDVIQGAFLLIIEYKPDMR